MVKKPKQKIKRVKINKIKSTYKTQVNAKKNIKAFRQNHKFESQIHLTDKIG